LRAISCEALAGATRARAPASAQGTTTNRVRHETNLDRAAGRM
jgi:hypothetical protein